MIVKILSLPWKSILPMLLLGLVAFLIGFLVFIQPQASEKNKLQTQINSLQSSVSPDIKPLPQLSQRPAPRSVVRYVQAKAQAEGFRIDRMEWQRTGLEITSQEPTSQVTAFAEALGKSVQLGKEIQVEGPGVVAISLRSDFLPRSTIVVRTIYQLNNYSGQ